MIPSSSNQNVRQVHDSSNSLYMTSETTGSSDSLQMPPHAISKASRHFGNISMAMIDDFFTTSTNSMKLPLHQSKIKFIPPPTSARMQYTKESESTAYTEREDEFYASNGNNRLRPSYRRDEQTKADFDYAKIKQEYESQLKKEKMVKMSQERKDANENSSLVGSIDHSGSVVGSNMSQV
jgi:hypothetical protein